MQVKLSSVVTCTYLGISLLILGCGGQKETLQYEPPSTPEPEPVEVQPEIAMEPEELEKEDLFKSEPIVLETIQFEYDKAHLTQDAKLILAENARKLEENPNLNIRIEGHCDERGTVEYNLALGERRAISTRNYFVNYGIASSRITVISYGKERPLDPRQNLEAWSKNRRAQFIILNQ